MTEYNINNAKNDIENLQDQNSYDFQEIKRLDGLLKDYDKRVVQAINLNNQINEKIQYDYENIKKVIIDENVSATLDKKIDDNYNSINNLIDEKELNNTNKFLEINNKITDVNSQLITKANTSDVNSKIWTMANMSQDIKEAMTGGSVPVVGKNSILEENIVDRQVTRGKLSNVMCGRDFEVNITKAYPGISFIVNNAPNGKNITLKCKITAKSTPRTIRFAYNYGGSYQEKGLNKPLLNVEQVYEHTWENTSDRVITSFNISVNNSDVNTNLNALIKEVRLYIDGKEHFDFDIENDIGVIDLTDYSYTLASRKFVEDTIANVNTPISVDRLNSRVFGNKYEVSGFTYAYPKLYLVQFKQQYPSGEIKFSFKVTPKNKMDYVKITTNAWQSPEHSIRVIDANETTLVEGSLTITREFNMLGISLSNSSPNACLDGVYEDFTITVDDKIVDFEMATDSINEEDGKTIVDVSEEQYLVASKKFVKNSINETFKNSLLEDRWRVNKTSSFLNFTLEFKPIILQSNEMVSLEFSIENYETIRPFFARINYDGTNRSFSVPSTINGGTLTHLRNIPSIQFNKGETINGLNFGCDTSSITTINAIFSGIRIKVGGKYHYPYKVSNKSTPEEVYKIQRNSDFLVTKDMLDKYIPKQNFTLPFVNNLYVVQGSKRKNSVPIFIDYLYDGNYNKILFENGEDRAYIREAVLSPNSQSKNIINTKETLNFTSPTLEVAPITFNKISIEEKTPNGKIRLLIIGDSVTAGAITEKQYWAVANELFAMEDIDRKRTSDVMFLGSINVRNTTINYNGVEKQVKSCACGISSWSLKSWLTSSSSHFVYDNNGTPTFSILKWLERYRTHLDDGTKLELGDSRLGTNITSSNINNIQCCTPNIVYINSTHNGGSIEEHEQMIEIIQREIPNCKIIVGNPMPLTGTWHKEKYVGKDWFDDKGCITGPNYGWGGGYGTSRIESLNYYTQRERENTDNTFYFMPQVVTMPTVEALEYDLVDCGVKMLKQPSKVNQLPKEHPGTLTHKIWGYELYALLKYISGIEQGATNNFDTVPLFD